MIATLIAIYAGFRRWPVWSPLAILSASALLRIPAYQWRAETFGSQRLAEHIAADLAIMAVAAFLLYGIGRASRLALDRFRAPQ